jgi:ribosomal protein S8
VEASLIGKALNFGFNDYGFESHASKINYNRWLNYVANHINLNIAKKNLRFTIVCNKTTLSILNLFKVSGFILAYHLITKNGQTSVVVYIYFYKKTLLFRNLKIISTASRSFFITRKALFLIEKRTLNSILMLSTSHGIISHTKALQKGIGGKLLFLVF